MRYGRLKVLTLLATISVCTGCSTPQNSPAVSIQPDWNQLTIQKVQQSQDRDGGFLNLIDERPFSFYTTLYDVELLKRYGEKYMENDLRDYLLSQEANPIKIQGINDISELECEVKLDRLLGITPSKQFIEQINMTLSPLERTNGMYSVNSKDDALTQLAETEEIVNIYSELSITRDWSTLKHTMQTLNLSSLVSVAPSYNWTIVYSVDDIEQRLGISAARFDKSVVTVANSIFSRAPKDKYELINDSSLYQLIQAHHQTISISGNFRTYLSNLELNQGGFNLMSPVSIDPQQTLDFINFYGSYSVPKINKLLSAIKESELSNGMFVQDNYVSGIEPTYMAFRILELLNASPSPSIDVYLKSMETVELTAHDRFYLGLGSKTKSSTTAISTTNIQIPTVLNDEFLYSLLTDLNSGLLIPDKTRLALIKRLRSMQRTDGGFSISGPSNLLDTRFIVMLLTKLYGLDGKSNLEKWVLSMQQSNGGFSTKGPATLVDTFNAVMVLQEINAEVPQKSKTADFLNSFRVRSGGFSLQPHSSTASLAGTYAALTIQSIISGK